MTDLTGKIAFITAAAQGIGRASALRFAKAGATVIATDINEAALQILSTENAAVQTRVLDVRSGEAVNRLVADLGRVDILFNCAGYVHQGTILDCEEKDWAFSFDLNVSSMYRTCKAVLPGMIEASSGVIVNMSSVVSSIKGAPKRFAYGTTKAAVVGLSKAIAADYVAKGIRCNALCPGTTETPSLGERIAAQGDYDTVRAAFISRQPIGRLGTPDEIAAAVLFLASDESSFITGQALAVDGGWSI